MLKQRYFYVLLGYRLQRGPGHIHQYFFIDEMYLDFDDTRRKKARAAKIAKGKARARPGGPAARRRCGGASPIGWGYGKSWQVSI